jgi:hypothetical protein
MLELTTRFILPRDLSEVRITVEQSERNPVISVDGDGKAHALRKGKVTITGEFAGMRDRVVAMFLHRDHDPRTQAAEIAAMH